MLNGKWKTVENHIALDDCLSLSPASSAKSLAAGTVSDLSFSSLLLCPPPPSLLLLLLLFLQITDSKFNIPVLPSLLVL